MFYCRFFVEFFATVRAVLDHKRSTLFFLNHSIRQCEWKKCLQYVTFIMSVVTTGQRQITQSRSIDSAFSFCMRLLEEFYSAGKMFLQRTVGK